MYSRLSNNVKAELVRRFDDLKSLFKVLVMLYNIIAIWLNLQKACNKAI